MAKGADAKWQKIHDGVTDRLKKMVERGKSARAFISRRVFPMYKEFQMLRWASENEGKWPSLTSISYMEWKRRKFATAIGQGSRMMIASGELLRSVLVQPGSHGRSVITDTSLTIAINDSRRGGEMDYALYANEIRNYTKFPPIFVKNLKSALIDYLVRGKA